MDLITIKIAVLTITQVIEAKHSDNVEKVAFIKGLKLLRTNGRTNQMTVDQITDRHSQIRTHLRENEKDTIHQFHQFDIRHFCKSIMKNLVTAAKMKPYQALNRRIKSIINHLWCTVSTCNRDETLLRKKWCNILLHIQNKNKSSSYSKFDKCVHPKITKSKAHKKLWLKAKSDTFKALQSIVLDKNVL